MTVGGGGNGGKGVSRNMPIIYHLTNREDWAAAQAAGQLRPESLAAEGFIHCSQDPAQMLRVAQRLYAGRADLLALAVDTALLAAPVVTEPSRSGELYPHIYGPLEIGAVVNVRPLTPEDGGGFALENPLQ